jgi:hypothetical protein
LPSSLATFLNFFDQTVFGMLAQRIKQDFALTDEALGFLGGPASVIFFVVVGIPLARLADIYPRRLVLAGGMLATATIMALGGMAQTFGQFVGSRMFLGAGGSAHAPASYSLLADFFPPKKITRAFAVLQLGFIGGTTVGVALGGKLIMALAGMPDPVILGLHVHSWQLILLGEAALALLAGLAAAGDLRAGAASGALRPGAAVPERRAGPARAGLHRAGRDARDPCAGPRLLPAVPRPGAGGDRDLRPGVLAGAVHDPHLWLERGADRHGHGADAAGQFAAGHFPGRRVRGMDGQAPQGCQRALRGDPVRPGHDLRDHGAADAHGRGGLAVMALGGMFGLAGAVPQNAAIQRIAPNEMRGQVTAIYLFMFTFFGAMGSFVVGVVAQRVVGVEAQLWKALVITAGRCCPSPRSA